ncbi:MAG: hypothetical protein ACM3Q2_10935 [Syntrophothermus sp.]
MSYQNSASVKPFSLSGLQVKETIVMLSLAVLLPFLIHFLPAINAIPAGAYLIPIFFVALMASFLFKLHVGLIMALLTPAVNYWLTGSPRPEAAVLLTLELVVFVVAVSALKNVKNVNYAAALLAFAAAKAVSLAAVSLLIPSASIALTSALTAIPGLVILQALNIMLIRYKK